MGEEEDEMEDEVLEDEDLEEVSRQAVENARPEDLNRLGDAIFIQWLRKTKPEQAESILGSEAELGKHRIQFESLLENNQITDDEIGELARLASPGTFSFSRACGVASLLTLGAAFASLEDNVEGLTKAATTVFGGMRPTKLEVSFKTEAEAAQSPFPAMRFGDVRSSPFCWGKS